MKRALLVANPAAQSGRAETRIVAVRDALLDHGVEVTLLSTQPAGRTPAAVTARMQEGTFDTVVAMGGDGTFADAGKGILGADRRCPLALIPAGTANDQARSLGIPLDPMAALEVACAGYLTHLDVGEAQVLADGRVRDEQLFLDSLGLGFQVDVLKKRGADREAVAEVPVLRELYRDYAVYGGALLDTYLRSFVEPVKMSAELVADGKTATWPALLDLVVKNTAVYGGAWVLARDSAPDDGQMEVVPFTGRRDLLARIVHDLMVVQRPAAESLEGGIEALGIVRQQTLRASDLEIVLRRPERPEVAAQLDGEVWCEGRHFRVRVLKQALDVVTPAGFAPPWR
ncbi:MAG: hypothetical protein IT382_02710 [Deltaproteobacteria bacterium]|nr:hypothetical protein [Deltaproteobacteria bacterium]